MKLSIIVPAYNEEKKLKPSVEQFYAYLQKQNFDFEIIIVDDGSNDRTVEVATCLISELKNIKLIRQKINQGKGAAIRLGLLTGTGDYRLFIDADNATGIEHLDNVWPLINSGYNIIIGTRNKKDAAGARQAIGQKFWKKTLGILGNKVIRIFTIRGIRDTQCGFKLFSKQAVENIMPKTKINRWAIDVEILLLARKLGFKIGLIPVVWYNRANSRVKIKDYFYFLKDVAIIKYRLLTGGYNLK